VIEEETLTDGQTHTCPHTHRCWPYRPMPRKVTQHTTSGAEVQLENMDKLNTWWEITTRVAQVLKLSVVWLSVECKFLREREMFGQPRGTTGVPAIFHLITNTHRETTLHCWVPLYSEHNSANSYSTAFDPARGFGKLTYNNQSISHSYWHVHTQHNGLKIRKKLW
jgi:hypothetical protein